MLAADFFDASHQAHVFKLAFDIAEQGPTLRRKVGDKDIGPAIVIVVAKIHAHTREGAAIVIPRQTPGDADFLKLAVPKVAKELLWLRVVGNNNIGPAIMIVVVESNTQSI